MNYIKKKGLNYTDCGLVLFINQGRSQPTTDDSRTTPTNSVLLILCISLNMASAFHYIYRVKLAFPQRNATLCLIGLTRD